MSSSIGELRVRVAAKTHEADDICSFDLVAEAGGLLPAFSAGSHIDVRIPGGLTRQYSLCNEPGELHRYQIAVLRDARSRGGSVAMHDHVQIGDTLTISPPRNHFALAHESTKSILVAGGIGITPILCMAERLAVTGAPFDMHYCTRSRARTAFADRIGRSAFAGAVTFHHDDGPAQHRFDVQACVADPAPGSHLYVCGPKPFIDLVIGSARASGWPDAQLHREFFAADPVSTHPQGSFELVLASSGRVVVVRGEETALEALAKAGVDIPSSCEQGVCGTCVTRVLEGEPDHRDLFFTADEHASNDRFLPCCSRAKSRQMVVDL